MKVLLVTGGAGFIGSNFIRYFLENYEDFVLVNYDKLTYAGNLDNLQGLEVNPRYHFVQGDICDAKKFTETLKKYNPEYIINFAAESHVDRSIEGPLVFGQTNVLGTLNLLQCSYTYWKDYGFEGKRFLQVSTDEVYGSLENDVDLFTESTNLQPNSPYSASKAGADLLARAFYQTYKLPVLITRCCNNYGPYQYSEKFIPTCIAKALNNMPIPIYGSGSNVREWIHVLDHCTGIIQVLLNGTVGEVYNIGSGEETSNIEMAKIILKTLGKPEDAMVHVADRLGHDRRYAIDSTKTRKELHWSCKYKLEEGMAETIRWYRDNEWWWGRN